MHWTWWYVLVAVDLAFTALVWLPWQGDSYAHRALLRLLNRRIQKKHSLDPLLLAAFGALMDLPRRNRDRVVTVIKKAREHGAWPASLRTPEQNESIAMFAARLREHGVDPLRYGDGEDDEDTA